jgi:hypothetical protein
MRREEAANDEAVAAGRNFMVPWKYEIWRTVERNGAARKDDLLVEGGSNNASSSHRRPMVIVRFDTREDELVFFEKF